MQRLVSEEFINSIYTTCSSLLVASKIEKSRMACIIGYFSTLPSLPDDPGDYLQFSLDRRNFGFEESIGRSFFCRISVFENPSPGSDSEDDEHQNADLTLPSYDESKENFVLLKDKFFELLTQRTPLIDEDENGGAWGYTINVPLWFLRILEPLNKQYFATHEDLAEALSFLFYTKFDDSQLYDMLKKTHPRSIDCVLRRISVERKLNGLHTQISNLKRSLKKVDPFSLNIISERKQQIYLLEREIDFNLGLMQNIKQEEILIQDKRRNTNEEPTHATPSMDVEQQNETVNQEDQSMNTALGATAIDTPNVVQAKPPNVNFISEVLSDLPHCYPDLTERWILSDRVNLTPTINQGDVVAQWHLPAFPVINNWQTPNMLPFKTHEFFVGDMDLKFQWNIPKTNQFAASIGVYYHWLQRDRPQEVINVWTVSQMPGGSLNGHTKNSTEINIPYMSHHPVIPIWPNNFAKNLYYATVTIIALTPFEVSEGAVDRADLNMYFRFGKNLQFFGQRPQIQDAPSFEPFEAIHATPSMFTTALSGIAKATTGSLVSAANTVVSTAVKGTTSAVISATEKTISTGLAAISGNRDKPTTLTNEPLHIRATTNIASGAGNFAADKVSLEQTSSAPHPEFLTGIEKFNSVDQLVHTQGFVNSFRVNVTDTVGTQLCRMTVQPAAVEQFTGGLFNASNINNWTPLDHIAGWYANYQMKIHYRFIPVVDGFKTFRIRVVFAPNVRDLTFEESNGYYYETFDIGADLNTQVAFDFITPYITSMLNFNSRLVVENHGIRAGVVAVFLETAINMPANLVDHCNILVYKAAAKGPVVLSVPRNNFSMLVYDPASVPEPPIPDPPPPPPPTEWIDGVLRFQQFSMNVIPSGWNGQMRVSVVGGTFVDRITSSVTAPTVSLIAEAIRNPLNHSEISDTTTPVSLQGTWNPSTIQVGMWGRTVLVFSAPDLIEHRVFELPIQFRGLTPIPVMAEEAIEVHPSMDQREAQTENLDLTSPLCGINEAIHGESHMDLQTLLRRFQYYHTVEVSTPGGANFTNVLSLPLNFGGALFRENLNQMQRSDKIVHLHDAFRFTRGSLRLMFIVTADAPVGTILIQHNPQAIVYPFTDGLQLAQTPKVITGFGESLMSLWQNNIHTVEFPLYLPNSMVLNAAYLSSELQTQICQGLGTVNLQWQGPATNLRITILRAFADDTAMYMFNGFPLRNHLPTGDPINFYPPALFAGPPLTKDGDVEANPGPVQSKPLHATPSVDLNVKFDESSLAAIAQMRNLSMDVDFKNLMPGCGKQSSTIITLLTQISHILNNPTKITFILSGCEVLNAFGVFSLQCLKTAESYFERIWNFMFGNKTDDDPMHVHSSADCDNLAEFGSFLFSSIGSYFGVKNATGFNRAFNVAKETATTHGRVVSFFQQLLSYIREAIIVLCENYFPTSSFLKWLKDDLYTNWIRVASILSDETIFGRIKGNPKATELVYITAAAGEELMLKLSRNKRANGSLARLVNSNLIRILRIRDKLGKQCKIPMVKFEPFVFYIAGKESQIGKSSMLEEIARSVADACGVPDLTIDSPIYIVPTDQYWEGYESQPILIFDDFARTKRQQVDENDASRLAGLVGPADFTIPIAFEGKGKVSAVKLIGCASNYSYPHLDGISDNVVWSRRHVLFEVSTKKDALKNCGIHKTFRFACGECVRATDPEVLKSRSYLKIEEKDPKEQTADKIGGDVSFEQMKNRIVSCALSYYKQAMQKYEQQVKDHCARLKVKTTTYSVPQEPIENFDRVLSQIEYMDVLNDLGTFNPQAHPSMFSWFRTKKQLVEEDCCHDSLTTESAVVFTRSGYSFPQNNATHEKCSELCLWESREVSFFHDWYQKQKEQGAVPKEFPARLNPDMATQAEQAVKKEVTAIKRESWYQKKKFVLGVIAGAIAVIGAGFLLRKLFDIGKDQQPKPEAKSTPEMAHPALLTSGDVKTKFVSRFSTKRHATRKYVTAGHATSASDDELAAMIRTYMTAIAEMSYNKVTARTVCIEKGYFLTQFHSIATILTSVSNDILASFREGECCTVKCARSGEQFIHCSECVTSTNKKHPILIRRRTQNGGSEEISMTLSEFMEINGGTVAIDQQGSDIAIFKLPESVHASSIRKYLADDTSVNWADSKALHVCDPGRIDNPAKEPVLKLSGVQSKQTKVYYTNQNWCTEEKAYFLLHGYVADQIDYSRFSTACGSIIFDPVNLKILGFLSSTTSSLIFFNAFSSAEVREATGFCDMLEQTLTGLGQTEISLKQQIGFVDVPQNTFKTQPAMKTFHSTKTAIRESICHEKFGPVIRRPCNISQDGDMGETAFVNGINNYVKHKTFPLMDIQEAYEDVSDIMCRNAKPVLQPVVSRRTMREAVCGIEGHISRLTMQTSPGFPWCCYPETKKKKDLLSFDEEHDLVGIHADLLNLIRENDEKMRKGVVPLTIYQISHKDERLPLNKLNNVRLIQGSPLDLTISARQHFMDFNYAFQVNRFSLEHRVGINPASLEWDEMTTSLLEFSKYICVGDYSKFGPRLLTEFVEKAYEIMSDWYTYYGAGEDNNIRSILAKRSINCANLAYDCVVTLECGSPSGAFNTVIVNSICNMLYIRCAWIGIMKQANISLSSLDSFKRYVKFICYGDDVIFAVKPEVIELFNNQTICDYFARYDVKYTDITKGDTMRKWCEIEEASFLKCGFRFFTETSIKPGVWLCLPQLEDIKDTTNWVRKPKGLRSGVDIEPILIKGALDNCNDAIRKMWFHGKEMFEEFQNEVLRFWRAQDPSNVPKRLSYRGLQREYGIPNKEDDIMSLDDILLWQDMAAGKVLEVKKAPALETSEDDPHCEAAMDILIEKAIQPPDVAPLAKSQKTSKILVVFKQPLSQPRFQTHNKLTRKMLASVRSRAQKCGGVELQKNNLIKTLIFNDDEATELPKPGEYQPLYHIRGDWEGDVNVVWVRAP